MARLRAWAIVIMIGFGILAVLGTLLGSVFGRVPGGDWQGSGFMTAQTGASATPKLLPKREVFGRAGEVRSLADLRGKLVVLNIWATSCAPCVVEMPDLDGLQAKLGSDKFVVAPVALQPDRQDALDFYAENALTALPFFHDPTLNIGFDIAARGMPTTVVFNPDGVEIARHAGIKDWDSDEAIAYFRAIMADYAIAPQ